MALNLKMIVTGGQTGVDRGALDAALAIQFPCGGWCPQGRIAEDGVTREVSTARAAALGLEFIESHDVSVLNVAGPRLSHWPGAEAYAREVLGGVIQVVRKDAGHLDQYRAV